MSKFENKEWREKMRISLDFNNVMSDFIGDNEGIKKSELDNFFDRIKQAAENLEQKRKNGKRSGIRLLPVFSFSFSALP